VLGASLCPNVLGSEEESISGPHHYDRAERFRASGALLPIHRIGNLASNNVHRSSRGICCDMSVSLRGAGLGVTQQISNDWQAEARANSDTRKRVPQVMNADIFDSGAFAD
jgi:hypothetical protein